MRTGHSEAGRIGLQEIGTSANNRAQPRTNYTLDFRTCILYHGREPHLMIILSVCHPPLNRLSMQDCTLPPSAFTAAQLFRPCEGHMFPFARRGRAAQARKRFNTTPPVPGEDIRSSFEPGGILYHLSGTGRGPFRVRPSALGKRRIISLERAYAREHRHTDAPHR